VPSGNLALPFFATCRLRTRCPFSLCCAVFTSKGVLPWPTKAPAPKSRLQKRSAQKKQVDEAKIASPMRKKEAVLISLQKFIAKRSGRFRVRQKIRRKSIFRSVSTLYASFLDWISPAQNARHQPPPFLEMVVGQAKASYNASNRHLAKYENKDAFIFVRQPEDEHHTVSPFRELYRPRQRSRPMLSDFAACKRANRVTIHMPMIRSCPSPMLAAPASA